MSKLQREAVINTALNLLNEVGVDGLTTRRLAERLGVQQPALYWHFKNKRALLDALGKEMLASKHTRSLPMPGEDWRSFLLENARSFRQTLLAYRDGARIHAGTRPDDSQYEQHEAQLQVLYDAGFCAADAVYALLSISHYVVGAVLEEQASETDSAEEKHPPLLSNGVPPLLTSARKHLATAGPDEAFEYGLTAIVDGLAAKLRNAGT